MMETRLLVDAIEPDYWNVVFHPSERRLARIFLGRFQHVSAFTYLPGFAAWVIYDVQWSGMRLAMFTRAAAADAFIRHTRDCTVLKVSRANRHMGLATRFGFYCVPAIKHLLGLSCVAVTPDGLYRVMIKQGAEILVDARPKRAAAAAARSDAATGTAAGAE